MSGDKSLEDIENGLQSILEALKSVTRCSKAQINICELKEDVAQLVRSAEKIDFNDCEFQEYKKQLSLCLGKLTELEQPGKVLSRKSDELKNKLRKVVEDKKFLSGDAPIMKSLLEEMLDMAKGVDVKIIEFLNGMELARKHCENAIKNANAEEEKVKNAKTSNTIDIVKGVGLASLGGAAIALGITGILTGGAAFVAAGVVGAAAGGAAIAGGAALTTVGALSRQELNQKANGFHDALKGLEEAMKTLRHMKENDTKAVGTLTDDMIKSLEVGLALYGTMVENAREIERLKEEKSEQAREIKELASENEELVRKNEDLLRRLQEMERPSRNT